MSSEIWYVVLAALSAFLVVLWVFPRILAVANQRKIFDNPDARKLQRRPIPLLGGVAVFCGLLVALAVGLLWSDCTELYAIFGAMFVMLCVGTWDDVKDVSPLLRLLIEIAIVMGVILLNGTAINDFHGLFGLGEIAFEYAIPLTVFAAVGIINAINLIDGVDGLSSGFCIMASGMFALFFSLAGDVPMLLLAVVVIGALIPFFFHNVFGLTSKMFMGDGGTLVLGVIMSTFVIAVLKSDSACASYAAMGWGLIPCTLAILVIPIFDTLRVMMTRIVHGESPFHPDKTHLHHIFIELGCSHPGTTFVILTLNCLVVGVWWLSAYLGCSVDVQLLIVICLGLGVTNGVYHGLAWHIQRNTQMLSRLRLVAGITSIQRYPLFYWLRRNIDKW